MKSEILTRSLQRLPAGPPPSGSPLRPSPHSGIPPAALTLPPHTHTSFNARTCLVASSLSTSVLAVPCALQLASGPPRRLSHFTHCGPWTASLLCSPLGLASLGLSCGLAGLASPQLQAEQPSFTARVLRRKEPQSSQPPIPLSLLGNPCLGTQASLPGCTVGHCSMQWKQQKQTDPSLHAAVS